MLKIFFWQRFYSNQEFNVWFQIAKHSQHRVQVLSVMQIHLFSLLREKKVLTNIYAFIRGQNLQRRGKQFRKFLMWMIYKYLKRLHWEYKQMQLLCSLKTYLTTDNFMLLFFPSPMSIFSYWRLFVAGFISRVTILFFVRVSSSLGATRCFIGVDHKTTLSADNFISWRLTHITRFANVGKPEIEIFNRSLRRVLFDKSNVVSKLSRIFPSCNFLV